MGFGSNVPSRPLRQARSVTVTRLRRRVASSRELGRSTIETYSEEDLWDPEHVATGHDVQPDVLGMLVGFFSAGVG